MQQKLKISDLAKKKAEGQKLTQMLVTNHRDAAVADAAGVDIITASDAAGLMLFGMETTRDMTLTDMILVGRGVARHVKRAVSVVAMPYWTYQVSPERAVDNAGALIQQTGADAVSCEVSRFHRPAIQAIVRAGIPVQAHIGLSSQRSAQLGGVRGLGKTVGEAWEFIADAEEMVEAGCFSIIAELLAEQVTEHIATTMPVPVISIGSGAACDGQGGLFEDLYGLAGQHVPRHASVYHKLVGSLEDGMNRFIADIESGAYPTSSHSVAMSPTEARKFKSSIRTYREQAAG